MGGFYVYHAPCAGFTGAYECRVCHRLAGKPEDVEHVTEKESPAYPCFIPSAEADRKALGELREKAGAVNSWYGLALTIAEANQTAPGMGRELKDALDALRALLDEKGER